MSEWREYKVGDLVHLGIIAKPLDGNHGGIHPTSKDYVSKGIPFIMASDINNGTLDLRDCKFISVETSSGLKKGFAVEGDVLLTHKASIGRTAIVPKLSATHIVLTPQVTYYRVLDKERLNNKYLKYYFDSPGFQNALVSWSGSGSTRAYIGITDQLNLPIILPDVHTQREIAEILSSLDDKIEVNNRINENLEVLAQALFKQWFVEFEFPNENGEPYCSSGGEMVESELGLIPKGWEISTIGDIASVIDCLHSKKPSEVEEPTGFILLQLNNITDNGVLSLKDKFWVTEEDYRKWTSRIEVKGGDFVITNVGRSGAVSRIPYGLKAAIGRNMTALRLNDDFKNFGFVSTLLVSTTFKKEIANKLDAGTIMDSLNVKNIPRLKFFKAQNSVIEDFEKVAAELWLTMEANMKEIIRLEELRDMLLPKLMSGNLIIAEIEEEAFDIA